MYSVLRTARSSKSSMAAASVKMPAKDVALDRVGGALWGLYIADALAMPTHWYYGGDREIKSHYGGMISGYTKPVELMPGSIMNVSNTGGGGRGSDKGSIIGDVINHGKKKYWTKSGSYHYHCTLDAGENTLEAQLVRVVANSIADNGGSFAEEDMRSRYVAFMTTPGTHNDAYASTCHRMFFANMTKGVPLKDCPDNDGHNVDTIDGIAMTVPVILAGAMSGAPVQQVQKQAADCASVTRASPELCTYVQDYALLLCKVLEGTGLAELFGDKFVDAAKRRPDPVIA